MKNQKIIVFSLVIVFIGAALYYVISNRETLLKTPPKRELKQVEPNSLQTQSVTVGIVVYKVTPKTLTPNNETWDFEVSLDTHTGSLDQDLVSTVSLVDDKSNEYRPTKWIGDPQGGHHREGILKFSPVTPQPAFIEFNIKTPGSVEKNSLRWNI